MGRLKSNGRLALEKVNLIELSKTFTVKEIAEKYNSSTFMVYTVLSEQFKVKEITIESMYDWEEEQLQLKSDGSFNEIRNFLKLKNYEKFTIIS